ncbi:MAG: phosphocholine cytidylyltransferase family protein [Pseudomonadota bacterium]|nr:phosphocholine cytidylyltransferase family protein [Pseudomonadota bacterium]
MRALILAAGLGNRLQRGPDAPPKCLLEFAGRSLLARHLGILRRLGIDEVVLGVGYHAPAISAELAALGALSRVATVHNPRFAEGSIVTLWTLGEALACGDDVLLMDADVLYDARLLERLVSSRHGDCFLLDRDFEPGDEPVKLCLKQGRIVEFRKRIGDIDYDLCGESVGFFRLTAASARELAAIAAGYVAQGRSGEPYEEALRDLALSPAGAGFGVEDITGLPWIEIDFPDDVRRAHDDILPRLAGYAW